jgi:hypothetical protein
MPNLILTELNWTQRVRDKLGVEESYLPDAAIQQPEVITIAEANIIELVPEWESLTGTDRVYLEAAVVCECAVLLCPSLAARLPAREQGPHFTREVAVDWERKRQELEAERDSYIGKIALLPDLPHFALSTG